MLCHLTINFKSTLLCAVFYILAFQAIAQEQKRPDTIDSKANAISFAAYPAIGYTPETSLQLGFVGFVVHKNKKKTSDSTFYRPTSISPYFLYTLNNQILAAFDIDIYLSNGININGNIRYYKYPDFFYGIGNDNEISDEETYTDEYWRLEGRILKPMNSSFFTGIRYNLQHNALYKFEDSMQLDMHDFTGEEGGWSNGIGPAVLYDTRDNTLYPTRGVMARLEATFFSGVFGSKYQFGHYLIDLRKYWNIKSEKNVVAVQLYSELTSGDEIPFYLLPEIGGDTKLRGIENANLYRDKQSWYTQVEYRRTLFWRLGGVVYAGVGNVAPKIAAFEMDETKYVVGVGGRFQALKDEKFNIRLDIGLANDGQSAFYLSIREAF